MASFPDRLDVRKPLRVHEELYERRDDARRNPPGLAILDTAEYSSAPVGDLRWRIVRRQQAIDEVGPAGIEPTTSTV